MNKLMTAAAALLASLALNACAGDTSTYHNALTGDSCTPNSSYVPLGSGNGNGGHNSPTGIPGDNIDDPHSGKVDCYYDGNSGQGDDKKHPCAPGCDNQHCCVDVDAGTPPQPPPDVDATPAPTPDAAGEIPTPP